MSQQVEGFVRCPKCGSVLWPCISERGLLWCPECDKELPLGVVQREAFLKALTEDWRRKNEGL